MKKIRVIQIIELSILIMIAVGLISFLSSVSKDSVKSDFNFNWHIPAKNLTTLKEEEVNSSGIEKIKVSVGSADINIVVTDDVAIKVIESGQKNLGKEELFTLSNQKGVLTIARGKSIPRFVFWGWQQHKIELFIPKSYTGDLDLNTTSGDTKLLSELKLRNLDIGQSSGNIESQYPIEVQRFSSQLSSGNTRLDYLACNEYEIGTSSGNIIIDTVKGSGSIGSSSGNIKVRELLGGSYSIKASSGNIELQNVAGSGEASTTSGNINIDYNEIEEYSKLKASSGNLRVKLADQISFQMNAKCSSGNIRGSINIDYTSEKRNEAEAVVGNEPYAKLTLNTSSGDIIVD